MRLGGVNEYRGKAERGTGLQRQVWEWGGSAGMRLGGDRI